jgi:ketosteroid isomerase-like protein
MYETAAGHRRAMTFDEGTPSLADRLRAALNTANLDDFAHLLSENVTWGDVNDPRGCRNRAEVLAIFRRNLVEGASASIDELVSGTRGILVVLGVTWPPHSRHGEHQMVHQVYFVSDGLITEIRGFDDRDTAIRAIDASE